MGLLVVDDRNTCMQMKGFRILQQANHLFHQIHGKCGRQAKAQTSSHLVHCPEGWTRDHASGVAGRLPYAGFYLDYITLCSKEEARSIAAPATGQDTGHEQPFDSSYPRTFLEEMLSMCNYWEATIVCTSGFLSTQSGIDACLNILKMDSYLRAIILDCSKLHIAQWERLLVPLLSNSDIEIVKLVLQNEHRPSFFDWFDANKKALRSQFHIQTPDRLTARGTALLHPNTFYNITCKTAEATCNRFTADGACKLMHMTVIPDPHQTMDYAVANITIQQRHMLVGLPGPRMGLTSSSFSQQTCKQTQNFHVVGCKAWHANTICNMLTMMRLMPKLKTLELHVHSQLIYDEEAEQVRRFLVDAIVGARTLHSVHVEFKWMPFSHRDLATIVSRKSSTLSNMILQVGRFELTNFNFGNIDDVRLSVRLYRDTCLKVLNFQTVFSTSDNEQWLFFLALLQLKTTQNNVPIPNELQLWQDSDELLNCHLQLVAAQCRPSLFHQPSKKLKRSMSTVPACSFIPYWSTLKSQLVAGWEDIDTDLHDLSVIYVCMKEGLLRIY